MLTIRDEQFAAFRDARFQTFLGNIEADVRAELLRRRDPRADEPLAEPVREAVELAQGVGFYTRRALARFARHVVLTGPGWDTPAARAALDDPTASEETRLTRLEASGTG